MTWGQAFHTESGRLSNELPGEMVEDSTIAIFKGCQMQANRTNPGRNLGLQG